MPHRPTAIDVANYFLSLADSEAGDTLSNLSLNKLCYYAQGFHLALHGEPLFDEVIEAWTHGPVVPSVYHQFKKYRDRNIPPQPSFNRRLIPVVARDLLDEVYQVYGQYSAWKLRNMTHEEPPWRDAVATNGIISHAALRNYFITLVE